MLTVKPIQDKQIQRDICNLCGVIYDEEHFCYGGYKDDILTACCQFYLNGEYGTIDEIAYVPGKEDRELMILIGMSAISFIDICGVKKVIYTGKSNEFAKALGFIKNENGIYSLDIVPHKCCGGSH